MKWLQELIARFFPQNQKPIDPTATSGYTAPTPTPSFSSIPSGTDASMEYIRSLTPNGQTFEQAFPVATNSAFMQGVGGADQKRPGLANLLMLQALFESTMGRNSKNIFGVKPGGRAGASFESPEAALEYQLGPNVMGGGATPSMNLLEQGELGKPISREELTNFYSSYNPDYAYLDKMMKVLFPEKR